MSRRRIVLFVSLGLVVSLVLLAVGGVMVLTQTGWGQDQVRRLVQDRVTAAVHGRVYLGRISGSYLTGVTIDSVEIRDAEDSLFLATGPITVAYDPRDLIDKRRHFSSVDIQHPTVYLRQHENWDWNFRRIFRSGMQGPPSRGPQWGDYLVFDSVRVPKKNLVGEINKGWDIAKYLLTHERESIGGGPEALGKRSLVAEAVAVVGRDASGRLADPFLRADIARAEIDSWALSLTVDRIRDEAAGGQGVGAKSALLKYCGTEMNKRRYELIMAAAGIAGLAWEGEGSDHGALAREWLRTKANSIEGGTSEVMLNIIAKAILALPEA